MIPYDYEDFEELSEEEQEEVFEKSIAEVYEKAKGNVYETDSVFFIVTKDNIIEMPSDSGDGPKGGSYISPFRGPSADVSDALKRLMSQYGFNEYFFGKISDWPEEENWDNEEIFELFDDPEESIKEIGIIKSLQEYVKSDGSQFSSVNEIVEFLPQLDLEPDCLYYEWEGEYIDLYENIYDCGEGPGTYSQLTYYEYMEILEDLDSYKV